MLHNATVTIEEVVRQVARPGSTVTAAEALAFWKELSQAGLAEVQAGNRFLSDLFVVSLAMTGTFDGAQDQYDLTSCGWAWPPAPTCAAPSRACRWSRCAPTLHCSFGEGNALDWSEENSSTSELTAQPLYNKFLMSEQTASNFGRKAMRLNSSAVQGNRIRGLVTVMRVPKDEQDEGPRAPFLQFDSYTILNQVPSTILGKKVYALIEFGGAGLANLLEAVPVGEGGEDSVPAGDLSNEQITLVVGVITAAKNGFILTGSAYRIVSMEEDLKRLKNKRIVATGGIAQFHTEGGYFEAFMVEEYRLLGKADVKVGASATTDSLPAAEDAETLVYQALDGGTLTIYKTFPPTLSIGSVGETRTSGWSNFNLSPWYYITPPADGIYEFDFLGTPPSPDDIVSDALTNCVASYIWPAYPEEHLKGVRIYTETNQVEIILN